MAKFQGTYNTFNNNKSSLGPKAVRVKNLHGGALGLLEDSGDVVCMGKGKTHFLYFKLNKLKLRLFRKNTLLTNVTRTQLHLFLHRQRTPVYTRYKKRFLRYRNNRSVCK